MQCIYDELAVRFGVVPVDAAVGRGVVRDSVPPDLGQDEGVCQKALVLPKRFRCLPAYNNHQRVCGLQGLELLCEDCDIAPDRLPAQIKSARLRLTSVSRSVM